MNYFPIKNGFGTTVGTESSSLQGQPFIWCWISDRNSDQEKATLRNSQSETLQSLPSSAGIQETSKALYNNFEQAKSDAICNHRLSFGMKIKSIMSTL